MHAVYSMVTPKRNLINAKLRQLEIMKRQGFYQKFSTDSEKTTVTTPKEEVCGQRTQVIEQTHGSINKINDKSERFWEQTWTLKEKMYPFEFQGK